MLLWLHEFTKPLNAADMSKAQQIISDGVTAQSRIDALSSNAGGGGQGAESSDDDDVDDDEVDDKAAGRKEIVKLKKMVVAAVAARRDLARRALGAVPAPGGVSRIDASTTVLRLMQAKAYEEPHIQDKNCTFRRTYERQMAFAFVVIVGSHRPSLLNKTGQEYWAVIQNAGIAAAAPPPYRTPTHTPSSSSSSSSTATSSSSSSSSSHGSS